MCVSKACIHSYIQKHTDPSRSVINILKEALAERGNRHDSHKAEERVGLSMSKPFRCAVCDEDVIKNTKNLIHTLVHKHCGVGCGRSTIIFRKEV